MSVGSRSVRLIMCAALAAALGTFGTAARAVAHSLPFDPVDFAGVLNVDIPPPCMLPISDVHSCLIDFLSVDFFDADGNHWVTGTPFSESDLVQIDGNGQFFALAATLTPPFFGVTGDTNGCDGSMALVFELPSEGNNSQRFVSFSCSGVIGANTGTYSVSPSVPEPAILALLGLGFAGLAASRRRKLN